MTTNILAIIATVTLAILVLGVLFLPYLAAVNNIPYKLDTTLMMGAIGALSGIVSAVIAKKLANTASLPGGPQDPTQSKPDTTTSQPPKTP